MISFIAVYIQSIETIKSSAMIDQKDFRLSMVTEQLVQDCKSMSTELKRVQLTPFVSWAEGTMPENRCRSRSAKKHNSFTQCLRAEICFAQGWRWKHLIPDKKTCLNLCAIIREIAWPGQFWLHLNFLFKRVQIRDPNKDGWVCS